MPKITEPMTAFTDYIITIEGIILSLIIFSNSENYLSRIAWACSFIVIAISAATGGTAHGFKEYATPFREKIIWKSTVILTGLGAVIMLIGMLFTIKMDTSTRYILLSILLVLYFVYVYWMTKHNEFIYVIIYYVPHLVVLLVLSLIYLENPGSIELIWGIVLTFIGFGIQAKQKGIHKHFNHNDIFHVIQMIAFYVFYLGVIQMTDA